MEDMVVLEWSFTPENYFEDELETLLPIDNEQYRMLINKGEIQVYLSLNQYNEKHNIYAKLYDEINKIFSVFLLDKYKSINISKNVSITGHCPKGQKEVIAYADTARVVVQASEDFIHKDKNGNVTYDSCKERKENHQKLIRLIGRCIVKDSFSILLLDCLHRAVSNKHNELVHLYEIREALSSKFGNQKMACQSLGINESDWSRLGELSNDLPVKQGRHVGKKIEKLRDATSDELNEARQIAQKFVSSYLDYLDNI